MLNNAICVHVQVTGIDKSCDFAVPSGMTVGVAIPLMCRMLNEEHLQSSDAFSWNMLIDMNTGMMLDEVRSFEKQGIRDGAMLLFCSR